MEQEIRDRSQIPEIRRAHRVQIPKVQEFSRESDFFTERERESERVKQENRF